MNTLAPPSLTSMRPGPRMISPPRISCSQVAVASGSGLRKWTWSQVTFGPTVGILVSPSVIVVAVLEPGFGVNLAAGHFQIPPPQGCAGAALLSGWQATFPT